jgi:hypothetical protein
VNTVDEIGARVSTADLSAAPLTAAIGNVFDFNRDRQVNAADAAVAGANYTFFLNGLNLIHAPAVTPAGIAIPQVLAPIAPPSEKTQISVSPEVPRERLSVAGTSPGSQLQERTRGTPAAPIMPVARSRTPALASARAEKCFHVNAGGRHGIGKGALGSMLRAWLWSIRGR